MITEDLLLETEQYWNLKPKSWYHETVSTIISQRVPFIKSRGIRSKLFEKIEPSNEFTFEDIQLLGVDGLMEVGISEKYAEVILNVPENIDSLDELIEISGIGPWTVKAVKLKCSDEDIFLSEDYWIRKHIGIIMKMSGVPTTKQVNDYIEKNMPHDRSIYSKFLWRLKHSAWPKIRRGSKLDRSDFV